jgi:hypothetical protein
VSVGDGRGVDVGDGIAVGVSEGLAISVNAIAVAMEDSDGEQLATTTRIDEMMMALNKTLNMVRSNIN